MKPIDLGGQVGQEQLQLGEEGEVVGGDVGMWAAADIVLYKPVGVQGAQDTQHVQVRLGVENIVNDTLRREKDRASDLQESTGMSLIHCLSQLLIPLWQFLCFYLPSLCLFV